MRWVRILAVLAAGATAFALHAGLVERRSRFPPDRDTLYLPAPHHMVRMSNGYREALADLVWVRALIFAGEHFGYAEPRWVERYVDTINALAPNFRRPYLWGGVTAIYSGAEKIERPAVDLATRIYRSGLERFPEDHQLLYHFGMLLTHQVSSTPGYSEAEREAAAAEGVGYIRRAAAFGADPLVRQYAATLVTDYATEELAIQFLEAQLLETEDEGYRRLLRKKLDRLVGDQRRASLEGIRARFVERHQAQLPYVPPTVFAVMDVGSRPFGASDPAP